MASSLYSSCVFPHLPPRSLHVSSPRTSFLWSCSSSRSICTSQPQCYLFPSNTNSLSFLSATSNGFSLSALLAPSQSSFSRQVNARSAAVIRAAFIFEWITRIFKFVSYTPVKLFVEKLEADLNKAAKMVKTGATVVIHIAEEAEEVAEEVEKISEQVEQFARKVSDTSDSFANHANDIFDVLEGEKEVVVTGYKIVDTKEITTRVVANPNGTTGNQRSVAIETVIRDVTSETNNPS